MLDGGNYAWAGRRERPPCDSGYLPIEEEEERGGGGGSIARHAELPILKI